jgi:predicted DNA-binding transcriptional regulator AlpA
MSVVASPVRTSMSDQSERNYIELEEVAEHFGVARGTIYHYMHQLKIERKKFPLDRHAYISLSDFEIMKAAKKAAQEKRH